MNQNKTTMSGLAAADRCVKCGLCLPHCPTFALTGNEADSPRGRISLIQMIAAPNPQWSPGLFVHLDRCLQCGACEAMCPSKVPYGALMDTARSVIEPHRKRSPFSRWLRQAALDTVASPRRQRWLESLLHIYRSTGLRSLVTRLPGLPQTFKRANRLLPPPVQKVPKPTHTEARSGTVSLFGGCTGKLFDQHTLNATQEILQILGYEVLIPDKQVCCGALHQHNGDTETAARLLQTNLEIFNADFKVICTASGCAARLSEYGSATDNTAAETFADRATEILHFLLQQPLRSLDFAPLAEKIGVYLPCTHRNVLKHAQDLANIMEYIPGVELIVINPEGGCCGAAGSYMLSQPLFADRLRSSVLDAIATSGARRIVTSNIGCSLHIQAGLGERGLEIEVIHPVVLLHRQLRNNA